MVTTDGTETAPGMAARRSSSAFSRYVLLALGAAAGLFAVGGRWDIAVAAWAFPVLLLRFTRTGRVWSGSLVIWPVNVGWAMFWVWESALGWSPVIAAGAAGLGALRTLPFLLDRLLAARLRPWAATLVFPAATAGAEFAITLLSPFGTAYGSLAVTQYGDLPLLQIVSVTGAYGIGFLIAWFAAVVNGVWERPSRRRVRAAIGYAAVLLAVVAGGGLRLALLADDHATVRVAGVSPAPALAAAQRTAIGRFADRRAVATAPSSAIEPAMTAVEDDLLAATRREAASGAKIVVWPEEGVQTQEANERAAVAAAQEEARRSGIYLEIGVGVYTAEAPYGRDEAMLIDPRGTVLWTYQKAHPIPGSEPFTPGDGRVPVAATPYGRIANVICYDADFPAMMRVRADVMLVPAHDWREYGGPHTKKAVLRAIEDGYALVRQDSEGVSAAFDDRGRVLATTDYFTTAHQATVAYVPVRGVTTIYDRIGDAFAWLCLAAVAGLGLAGLLRPAGRGPRTGPQPARDRVPTLS